MCDFEDGTRAATAARKASVEARRTVQVNGRVWIFSPVNEWHGFQPICIANSPSAVRCSQRTSDCYEVNRVSVVPRYADAVGSLKLVQRGNGDRENT